MRTSNAGRQRRIAVDGREKSPPDVLPGREVRGCRASTIAAVHGPRPRLRGLLTAITLAAAAIAGGAARAADLLLPIDLSGLAAGEPAAVEAAGAMDAAADPLPIVPVAVGIPSVAERFYVSGIIGGSFATLSGGGSNAFFGGTQLGLTGSAQDALFTGGGAVGLALPRTAGQLRLEVEGRSRGPLVGENVFVATTAGTSQAGPIGVTATGGWSSTANLWRDWFISDRFGFYGGGGFGAGGYRFGLSFPDAGATGSAPVTAFAWQVGTGVVYDWTDRVAIDVGYRYFALANGTTNLAIDGGPLGSLSLGSYTSSFNSSEVLLSVRIYEPFRAWR